MEKYPDHYVLVYDEKLVSASTDLKGSDPPGQKPRSQTRTCGTDILLN